MSTGFWVPGIAAVLLGFTAAFVTLREHMTAGEKSLFLLVFAVLTIVELVALWTANQRAAQDKSEAESAAKDRHTLEMRAASENHSAAASLAENLHDVAMAQAIANTTDLRARLDRSEQTLERMHTQLVALSAAEGLRVRAVVDADVDTTLAKVQALRLAQEIYGLLRSYYRDLAAGSTTQDELLSDFEMLYSFSVRKTRGELADRGKTDALLDRFAHKQMDSASIETTAQTIERLAEQLPEDDAFPTGEVRNDGSTALERYDKYIDGILARAKIEAAEAGRIFRGGATS